MKCFMYSVTVGGGGGGHSSGFYWPHGIYGFYAQCKCRQYTLMPLVHNPMHSCLHSALFCGTHTLRAHVYRLCAPCLL